MWNSAFLSSEGENKSFTQAIKNTVDLSKEWDWGHGFLGIYITYYTANSFEKVTYQDFRGCAVVKNPPANAGDTGSSPGPGRSHMPRSNKARIPQLLSLRSGARKPQLLSPRATTPEARMPRARALQQEKPPQWEARAPQRTVAPARRN